MIPEFLYVRPKSVPEALSHLGNGARVHAGGTDLLGCLRDRVFGARKVVSLSRLTELQRVERMSNGGLRLGAGVTLARIAEDAVVREQYPALAQGASEAASPQLRNQGTLGGNLCQRPRCWYFRGDFPCSRKGGDTCFAAAGENQYHCIFGGGNCFIVHPSDLAPALTAYEAAVEVVGPGGARRVPIAEFFVLPDRDVTKETVLAADEMVTAVFLPPVAGGTRASYRKVRARRAWDFALAGAALVVRFEGEKVARARVVLSGAAPIPWRSVEAEEAITGRELTNDVIERAAAAAIQKAKPLEHNGYKTFLFRGVLEAQLAALTRA